MPKFTRGVILRLRFKVLRSVSCLSLIVCVEVISVGKQIRGRLDVLSGQTGAVMVLGLAFLLSGLAGTVLAGGGEEAEYGVIRLWLGEAFQLTQEETPQPFWNLLWERVRLALPLLVLSTTPLGVPGLPLFFGWLGFRFAFPVSCLFRIYGLSALYPAVALFGLTAVLWIPLLFWTGSRGFRSALYRLKARNGEEETVESGTLFWQLICCVLLFLCVLIEYFAAPALLGAAARVIL